MLPAGGSLVLGSFLWLHQAGSQPPSSESALDLSDAWLDGSGTGWARRPVYRYSVIPGGVQSASELKAAIASDPVVAAHYRDFDLQAAHIIRLPSTRAFYVSYRLRNHILWTARRITLPAGEELITDGVHSARTRCGNMVVIFRPVGVSPPQSPPTDLDVPETPDYLVGFPPLGPPLGPLVGPPSDTLSSPPVAPLVPGLVTPGEPETPSVGLTAFPMLSGPRPLPNPCAPASTRRPEVSREFRPCSAAPACVAPNVHYCQTQTGVTPEPGAVLLFLTGVAYLAIRSWSRKRADAISALAASLPSGGAQEHIRS